MNNQLSGEGAVGAEHGLQAAGVHGELNINPAELARLQAHLHFPFAPLDLRNQPVGGCLTETVCELLLLNRPLFSLGCQQGSLAPSCLGRLCA